MPARLASAKKKHPPETRLRQLIAILRKNLERCAADPDIDAVHDLRTGTRRVQAMVETLLRERNDAALQEAADHWLKLLKKLRRAAAPVRDLDVHRKLLRKLVKYGGDHADAGQVAKPDGGVATTPTADIMESPATELPVSSVEKQADDLDAWLHHARQHLTSGLKKRAAKWIGKFDEEAAAFLGAVRNSHKTQRRTRSAAEVALEAFTQLAYKMPQLSADNLHDFRKGAKKCRYIAESAADDVHAQAIAKALKKLQDDIGDWHDWLVLAEEAHTVLGSQGKKLMDLIGNELDRHFVMAMKTVQRLRGKLLGEYLAITKSKRKGHP